MAVAPARKFTEAQLFFLEAEFNNGLTSTSMVKYGDRFRDLHEKTDLPIDQLQRWINNRSRGPRPTCFIRPNVNDDGVNMEAEKQDQKTAANIRKHEATGLYKKPPSTKCATGYAVFCGEVFRERKDGKPHGALTSFFLITQPKWPKQNVLLRPFGIIICNGN